MTNTVLCPLDNALRLLGDRWTLLILRDMIFDRRRCFRDLARHSREGIATNILTARLKRMVAEGMLTQADEPDAQGRKPYTLTEKSILLLPTMIELMHWGLARKPKDIDIRARLVIGGGEKLRTALQAELRAEHLEGVLDSADIRDRLRRVEQDVLDGNGPLDLSTEIHPCPEASTTPLTVTSETYEPAVAEDVEPV